MWISTSGRDRLTRLSGFAWRISSPSSRARSWLVNGWVPTRRVRRANVAPGDKAIAASETTASRNDARSAWTSVDALMLLLQAVLIFGVAFIYAILGLGGGLLFVPILLSTGVTRSDVAVPISLTFTIATAASSVINHHRKGLVDFRLGGTLVAGALVGAVLGTLFTLLVLVDDREFKAFFTTILLIFGVYMLSDWLKNARDVDEDDDSKMTPPRKTSVTAATVGSGFLSGSMGIGGGLLY